MSSRGPKPVEITLSDAERAQLERWTRRHRSAQALALRSRIALGAAAGGGSDNKSAWHNAKR